MADRSTRGPIRRRRELVFLLVSVFAGVLLVAWSLAGLLHDERWGEPTTGRDLRPRGLVPESVVPDFSAIWEGGGRNPFSDGGSALESGGKARLPLPSLPPLNPEPPPAPLPPAVDLMTTEGAK